MTMTIEPGNKTDSMHTIKVFHFLLSFLTHSFDREEDVAAAFMLESKGEIRATGVTSR